MSLKVEVIQGCRICGCKQLEEVFDLGEIYPSNFIPDTSDEYDKAPLTLVRCIKCDLVQLKHSVEPDVMYKTQYWYKSNLNKSMVKDLKDIVENIEKRVELKDGDITVDVGCNDGTLFDFYTNRNIYRCGFDPATNLSEVAKEHCTWFVSDYFSAEKFPYAYDKAKVITSIAMFYDLSNPNHFVRDIKSILDPKGIWVIQMTDLVSMLMLNAFDNICHEHLEYYSLHVLNNLLRKHRLEIFDLEWNTVNGGSLRVYVSFPGSYKVSENVIQGLMKEFLILNSTLGSFQAFKKRYITIIDDICTFLATEYANNSKIFGLGASTKGNTLLQKCGAPAGIIPFIAEVNKDKLGLKTIGTEIPIISETEALKLQPDYFLVLPWHFKESLLEKPSIKKYIGNGGQLLFPLPIPEIINRYGSYYL